MTNEEILKKAIERAKKNGYKGFLIEEKDNPKVSKYYRGIFDHDFAKAFFPKGWLYFKDGEWKDCSKKQFMSSETPFVYEKWRYYIRQMVTEKEPLKYLERFLEEGK
jgi:hypothetical protein